MTEVTRIEWTFRTSQLERSGTDSPVSVEIFRDGQSVVHVWDEPGETPRLDRGEVATRGWTFQDPTGVLGSNTLPPYTEDFPQGVKGHLRVRLKIWGEDAWRIGRIDSTVISLKFRHTPSVHWVEVRDLFVFDGEDVLSTDPSEGFITLDLNY